MPYVLRDARGRVDRIFRDAVEGAEHLPANHPDLRSVVGDVPPGGVAFATLDANLIRVVEDLVDALIARNVLCITDLPAEAQQKLFARKNFRDRVQKHALHLFTPESPMGDTLNTSLASRGNRPLRASRSGE